MGIVQEKYSKKELAPYKEKFAEDMANVGDALKQLLGAIKEYSAETHRVGGSASKKPKQKAKAMECWKAWASEPQKYKNKTAWCNNLIAIIKKMDVRKNVADSISKNTARAWCDEFRKKYPSPELEKILPTKK